MIGRYPHATSPPLSGLCRWETKHDMNTRLAKELLSSIVSADPNVVDAPEIADKIIVDLYQKCKALVDSAKPARKAKKGANVKPSKSLPNSDSKSGPALSKEELLNRQNAKGKVRNHGGVKIGVLREKTSRSSTNWKKDDDIALIGICVKHPGSGLRVIAWRELYFYLDSGQVRKWVENEPVYFFPDKAHAFYVRLKYDQI